MIATYCVADFMTENICMRNEPGMLNQSIRRGYTVTHTADTPRSSAVLAPLAPPYEPATEQILAGYPKGSDGYIIGLFRVFANSQRFLAGKGAVNLLDKHSPLSLREREIIILRTCANLECEYEWGVHVATFARAADLTAAQIDATVTQAPDADCWQAEEQLLIECVDAWCASGHLQAPILRKFRNTWDLAQQLEIMALVGNYHTVSFVANTAVLELEPGAPSFPMPS